MNQCLSFPPDLCNEHDHSETPPSGPFRQTAALSRARKLTCSGTSQMRSKNWVGTVRGQHHIAAVGWQRLCPQGVCPVRASFLAIHLDRQPETIDVKGISHQRADTAISRLFSGAQSFAPVSSPPNGTTMHPPNAFRVHSILPQLALDGAIIRLDQVRSTCRSCGLRSSMTRGAGFETDQKGTTLTCPACGATGLMDEMEIWHHWLEQCRRQQLLARSKQMIHSISRTRSE